MKRETGISFASIKKLKESSYQSCINFVLVKYIFYFFLSFLFPFQDLRQYLSTLAEQCSSEETDTELPTVVILDNLHHIGSLSDIFNGFLNCKYHKW